MKIYRTKRGKIELHPLHEDDYFNLSAQYEQTPAPGDGVFATGEHYKLCHCLAKIDDRYRGLDKTDGYTVATELLTMDYRRG